MSGGEERGRVFLGLRLDEALAREVAERLRPVLDPGAFRPTRPEDLHLTLVFLGSLPRERLGPLASALRDALAGLPRPALRLGATGAFPGPARPRVLWVGVGEREAAGRLLALRRAALAGLAAAGVALDAREAASFHPHVTVARPRSRQARLSEAFARLRIDADWTPDAIELLESARTPSGARYHGLERFDFSAAS